MSFVISINSERFCIRCSARIIACKVGGLVGGVGTRGKRALGVFWRLCHPFARSHNKPQLRRQRVSKISTF